MFQRPVKCIVYVGVRKSGSDVTRDIKIRLELPIIIAKLLAIRKVKTSVR